MNESIKLLDVVALTIDLPEKGLVRGQVGTVVEALAPGVYKIEFSDSSSGRAMCNVTLESGADHGVTLHARESRLILVSDWLQWLNRNSFVFSSAHMRSSAARSRFEAVVIA